MSEYKICYICEEKNEIDALECKNCGMDLSIVVPTEIEEEKTKDESIELVTEIKRNDDKMIEKSNDTKSGKTLILQEARLVSKRDGCEITLPLEGGVIGRENIGEEYLNNCKYVSSSHVKIYLKGTQYFILDENSTNGTKVNNRKLQKGIEVQLNSGDSIVLANLEFLFMCS